MFNAGDGLRTENSSGALIYPDGIPDWAVREMPVLYCCPYATAEYFAAFNPGAPLHLCAIEQPRHLLVFSVNADKRSADLLSGLIDIDSAALRTACHAIFQAFPRVRRLHLTRNLHPLSDLNLPNRFVRSGEDIVAALPEDMNAFLNSLGRKTRKHLQYYANRLRKKFANFSFTVSEKQEIKAVLVSRIVEMNRARIRAKGAQSAIDDVYEKRLAAFAPHWGIVVACRIGDEVAAGTLCYQMGEHMYLHVLAHDPAFDSYDIGQVALQQTVQAAISRGVTRFHMLWGRSEYKFRFGGVEHALYRGTVYRTSYDKWFDFSSGMNPLFGRLQYLREQM